MFSLKSLVRHVCITSGELRAIESILSNRCLGNVTDIKIDESLGGQCLWLLARPVVVFCGREYWAGTVRLSRNARNTRVFAEERENRSVHIRVVSACVRRARLRLSRLFGLMGILRIMMPPKFQLLALLAFAVAMLFLENQIQKLEESRGKLELAIARHEVREVEQRHTMDGSRELTLDESDDVVIIYNRVPKTASTSFTNIAYDLCGKNKYHVLHINTTKNNPVMSLQDQVRFVKNVTSWREMKPAFYHGHVAFLDFTKFGVKRKPIYINVIRDPIERLVSYYYFLRFGDDYRPGLRRRKQGDKKTFDECVSAGGSDCAAEKLWLQIPFFCGHYSECWNTGSQWALEQAKYNLVNEYLLVGVTEELEDFVMMLEAALPRYFRGATELYRTGRDFRLCGIRAMLESQHYNHILKLLQFHTTHLIPADPLAVLANTNSIIS
ncbi:hypothetical protein SKAU_G00202020 [Synaphobranchus kaupii]|uniref:Heparan sulfate 2-O-sulfotransferase 1 n=1 Tax=Synaphobranchus kaupii TaxID=118154 RepID=A0A9Q1FFP6_SYNKA|nr:hypothetical protein SKAU_G00202020 [Synaphobranchus kaupii]